jgi:hypothetical protein
MTGEEERKEGLSVLSSPVILELFPSFLNLPFLFTGDEDLYFPVVVPCFTCVNSSNFKVNSEEEVCVCDFSQKGENCGKAPKGCPKDTCSSSQVEEYCKKHGKYSMTPLPPFPLKSFFYSNSIFKKKTGREFE